MDNCGVALLELDPSRGLAGPRPTVIIYIYIYIYEYISVYIYIERERYIYTILEGSPR